MLLNRLSEHPQTSSKRLFNHPLLLSVFQAPNWASFYLSGKSALI
jgi:hypothetical protein